MFVEGLVLLSALFQFQVERSKSCLEAMHIQVAGSLHGDWVDEWTVVALILFVGVCTPIFNIQETRSIPTKRKSFDSTLGYPGEDGPANSSSFSH